MRKALASNPALHRQLVEINDDPEAKKRFDARVERLGQIIKDIDQESAAATNRVLEFLRDLYRLQLDLHEENLRHYRALGGVATAELKRWELLSYLNGRYRQMFGDVYGLLESEDVRVRDRVRALPRLVRPAASTYVQHAGSREHHREKEQTTFPLFPKSPRDAGTEWAGEVRKAGQPQMPAHPVIAPGAPILQSLRLLAETAREWQFTSPTRDPDGTNTRGSFHRLASGIELINGQLLMISVNERFSLENGLVLRTEVREHDLHLDAIAARTREAGIRLGLRDLVAYHSSGITNEDIQSVLGVIQQALLASICNNL